MQFQNLRHIFFMGDKKRSNQNGHCTDKPIMPTAGWGKHNPIDSEQY